MEKSLRASHIPLGWCPQTLEGEQPYERHFIMHFSIFIAILLAGVTCTEQPPLSCSENSKKVNMQQPKALVAEHLFIQS